MKKIKNQRKYPTKKSEFKDWESVFTKPASIKIETLKTGMIVGKTSGLINLNNINAVNL